MSESSNQINSEAKTNGKNMMETKYGTVEFRAPTIKSKCINVVKQNVLAITTMTAVILAIFIGIIIRSESGKWSERSLMYLEFPGEIFLRMLKCLILPLIISSLVSALGNLDMKLSGHIGKRAIIYYLTTTVMAIILGIILVLSVSPGGNSKMDKESQMKNGIRPRISTTEDTLLDLLRNLIPSNLVEATFSQYSTHLEPPMNMNTSDIYQWKIKSTASGGTNILGIVFFSIVLGVVLGQMQEQGKPLLDFFTSLSEATMKITNIVIKFTPVGVLFLVMPRIISVDDVNHLLESVGLFTLTVFIGLLIHGLIVLPAIFFLFVKRNPYVFMGKMAEALLTAFGTASSAATLPVTINCLEEKNKVDKRVVRFCVPIGATVNMDGTALYEAVAAIFIAQSRNVDMTIARVLIVSLTATAASIGAAGIPQAGLITMVIVLNALGLPAEDIALVIVIDWLLDRIRTPINVLGDAFGSAIVEHLSKKELDEFTNQQKTNSYSIKPARNLTYVKHHQSKPSISKHLDMENGTHSYTNEAFNSEDKSIRY